MSKEILRKKYLNKRDNIPEKELDLMNKKIYNKFMKSGFYKNSERIMSFISFRTEVDTHNIIKNIIKDGKKAYVPITYPELRELKISKFKNFNDLELGFYNILTPKQNSIELVDSKEIQLILVPGAIFSKKGYRVGYGGGYYDRFFSKIDKKTIKLGVCYDFQLVENLPIEDYDIPVDYIITEKRIIKCE